MWWGHGYGWEWTFFGGLMMILFWGGLLAVIIVAARAVIGSTSPSTRGLVDSSEAARNRPLNILKARFARSEITQAEYEEMRDVLNQA